MTDCLQILFQYLARREPITYELLSEAVATAEDDNMAQ